MERDIVWYRAEEAVNSIGIPVNYKGYYYLIYAVVISIAAGIRKVDIYKEVYEPIAAANKVSRESVEKCIRSCIKKVRKEDPDVFSSLAGHEVENPTNGEVIAIISRLIRLESYTGF